MSSGDHSLKVFGSASRPLLKNSIANYSMRRTFGILIHKPDEEEPQAEEVALLPSSIVLLVTPQFSHSHWRWRRKVLITSVWLRVGRKIPPCCDTIPWQSNAASNEDLHGLCKVQQLSQDTNDNILLLCTPLIFLYFHFTDNFLV